MASPAAASTPSTSSAVNTDSNSESTMKQQTKRGVPEGLWERCPGCGASIYKKEAKKNHNVCPQCEYHFYVSAPERVAQLLDEGTFEEWDAHLMPTDPLQFADSKPYKE